MRRTGSLAINADALHYSGDILMNSSVIATLLIQSALAVPLIDPLFGGAVGAYIIYGAVKIARLALTQLMDRELPDEERARVRAIAESHPEVTAVHDIRTRVAGPTAFIQLHIEMDGAMSLLRAHEISDAVEAGAARRLSARRDHHPRGPGRDRGICRLPGAARGGAVRRAAYRRLGAMIAWRPGVLARPRKRR